MKNTKTRRIVVESDPIDGMPVIPPPGSEEYHRGFKDGQRHILNALKKGFAKVLENLLK